MVVLFMIGYKMEFKGMKKALGIMECRSKLIPNAAFCGSMVISSSFLAKII